MSLSNLPFALETNVDFEQAAITGELRLQIVPSIPRPDLQPSIEVLDVFVDAVAMNFFFAESVLVTCRPAESKTKEPFVWQYAVQNLPVQSLCVLLALWAQTAWAGDEIRAVKISLTPNGRQNVSPRCHPQRVFAKPPAYPFPIQVPGDFDQSAPLELMVTFEKEIDPGEVESLGHLFQVWGFLDAMGGFELKFGEQEDFSPEFGDVAHLEPNVVNYSKSRIDGPLVALNLLYNGLADFARSGPKISSLQLES